MTNLVDIADVGPIQVWANIKARRVEGDQVTLAVVELEPGAVAPEHKHANEQIGIVLQGELFLRVADEGRMLGPSGTWRILANVPHSAVAGPNGAVVIDVFSPIRNDWDALATMRPTTPKWPQRD